MVNQTRKAQSTFFWPDPIPFKKKKKRVSYPFIFANPAKHISQTLDTIWKRDSPIHDSPKYENTILQLHNLKTRFSNPTIWKRDSPTPESQLLLLQTWFFNFFTNLSFFLHTFKYNYSLSFLFLCLYIVGFRFWVI